MAWCGCRPGARANRADSNASAFERLYVEHERELYGYVARRLDPPTAERVVAEVFADAWLTFADRDRGQCDRTWLFGLALHRLGSHRATELAHLEQLARGGPVRRAASGDEVARALADLDPVDRDMLTLHVWAGVEHESVAALTGVPEATVRRRIDHAHAFVVRRAGGA